MPTKALGYARISKDDQLEGRGVARQEADIRALCKRKRWAVAEVIVDNDISASRYSRKVRPGFQRLLTLIEAGAVDRVVVYDLDRLLRQPRELEDLIDLAEKRNGTFAVESLSGELNLVSSDGRFIARMLAGKAAKESDDASRRLRRAFDEKAAEGRPHGARAFGYEPDGVTVREHEAELYRQAIEDVLKGESLNAIARRWNEAGALTPQRNRQWSGTVVKATLTGPRHAGLRVHRGEIVGPGTWPALVDRVTHERVVRLLNDPVRRVANPPRRTPFTGLVRDVNGIPLDRDTIRGHPTYRGHNRPGRGAQTVTIAAERLEEMVLERVFTRLESPQLRDRLARARRKRAPQAIDPGPLERELVALSGDYGDGAITRAEWMTARAKLEKRLAAARATIAAEPDAALGPYLAGASLRDEWDELTADRRRAILGALIERITVHPAKKKGGPGVDPARIEVSWKA